MNANQDPEILRSLTADKKEGETTAEWWWRKAKKQMRDYGIEHSKHDPTELAWRKHREDYFKDKALVTPDDFPLDFVAPIAAKFLTGDNYAEAVERAIHLLQECKDTLTQNRAAKELYGIEAQRSRDLKADIHAPPGAFKISFRAAVCKITRQDRFDRAEPMYLAFLDAKDPSLDPKKRTELLKSQEDGIDVAEVNAMTNSFTTLKREGKIPKDAPPKKTQKKGLLAKRHMKGDKHGGKAVKSSSSVAKNSKPSAKRSKRAGNR